MSTDTTPRGTLSAFSYPDPANIRDRPAAALAGRVVSLAAGIAQCLELVESNALGIDNGDDPALTQPQVERLIRMTIEVAKMLEEQGIEKLHWLSRREVTK